MNSKRYQDALRCLNKALSFTPDSSSLWFTKGYALDDLGRFEEAIACYDQATKIKPDNHQAWYNKACCYGLQGNIELAIENLQQAINLNPECGEMAKTNTDFDNIREDRRFQDLIGH
ncbi:MAG: tetratricopeptide repeat protein [Nostoc sp. S4]|nr:tetratricopeptide repeat protein [Nostoc sp. S4]